MDNTVGSQANPDTLSPAFQQSLNQGNAVVNGQPVSNTIGSDQLKPTPLAQLPYSPLPSTSGTVAGLNTGAQNIDSLTQSLTSAPTAADQQNQSILDSIGKLTGLDTGKAAYQLQQENQLGLPGNMQALTDVNGQIQSGMAELKQMDAQNQQNNISLQQNGTPGISRAVGAVQSAALNRSFAAQQSAKAAEIGLLQARAAGLTGQINTAQALATRAVELKYQPVEDALKVQQAQLAALKPILDKQQAVQAEARQALLTKQVSDVAYQRDQAKTVAGYLVQFPKAGINENDTPIQAAQKAATWQAQNPGYGGKLEVIGSHFDDFGNKVDTYGFVNPDHTVTPYNADSGTQGNTNFGMQTGTALGGLPSYNTQANNPGVNRPTRNNNPGNIKATPNSIKYPGVVGIESTPAADGGNFLIFANPQSGKDAIGQLISNSSVYANISAQAAIKKYNGGGGYGASDIGLDPNKDFQTQLKNPTTLQTVVDNIARREGFTANSKVNGPGQNSGSKASAIDTTTPGYTTNPVQGAGGLTQSAIDQAALQFAITGQLPAGMKGTKGLAVQQQLAVKNRAGQLDAGGNITANRENLKALSSSLAEQTQYLNTVQRSVTNAENGFNQITSAFQNSGINPSQSAVLNSKANDAAKFFGNNTSQLRAFQAGLQEVANEYSNVFSRGGVVSDTVRNKAGSIFDGSISIKDLLAVQNELQAQGKIVIGGSQSQVKTIQDQINHIISPGTSSPSSSSTSGTSILTGPDGKQYNVPNDKVDAFIKAGGKR